MRIEHVAVWTKSIEPMVEFYCRYFGGVASERYNSRTHPFSSVFVRFADGARLEIMTEPAVEAGEGGMVGYAHIAIAIGARDAVDALTGRIAADGFAVLSAPRWTGDGYYESVVTDPDGNRVELTV